MAAATLRLYESPLEGSSIDLLYDDFTHLASGLRVVSGTGRPLRITITYLGVTVTRSYAPGTDMTWTFLVAPTVSALGAAIGFTAWGASHSSAIAPDGMSLPTL